MLSRKLRVAVGGAVLMLALVIAPGGCPPSTLDDTLGAGQLTGASFQQMLDSVSRALDSESAEQTLVAIDDVVITADDDPFFGLDPADFQTIDFADIPVSADDLFADLRDGSRSGRGGDDVVPDVIGGLAGRYLRDSAGGGVLIGRWFDSDGQAVGVLRGQFQDRTRGPEGLARGGSFEARIIDNTGRFRGLLRGQYGANADGEGVFASRWFDRKLRLVGVARGQWTDLSDLRGEFAGRWAGFHPCHRDDDDDDDDDFDDDWDDLDDWDDDLSRDIHAGRSILTADFADVLVAVSGSDFPIRVNALDDIIEGFESPLDTPLGLEGRGSPCPRPERPIRGGLRGRWIIEDDADTPFDGFWGARWRSFNGAREGYIRGLWKFRDGSSDSGTMQDDARARGRDRDDDDDRATRHPRVRGSFRGVMFNDDDQIVGYIGGRFNRARDGAGVYQAALHGDGGGFVGISRGFWSRRPGTPGGPIAGRWIVTPRGGHNDDRDDDDDDDDDDRDRRRR